MLFSKRNEIAKSAQAWCVARKICPHPLNIVTALIDLGIIKDDASKSTQPSAGKSFSCVCPKCGLFWGFDFISKDARGD